MLDEESGVPKGTRTYVDAENPRNNRDRGLSLPLTGGGFSAGVMFDADGRYATQLLRLKDGFTLCYFLITLCPGMRNSLYA